MKRLSFLFFVLFLNFVLLTTCLSTLTFAQESVETLPEIVVTATRIEETPKEVTQDITVITKDDIEKKGIEFITDVFRSVPELNLVQNGGAGKNATVILRGGSSEHILIMIDGVKVKSTTTGSFDFSGINVEDIERVEIVKGPQSTLYGSEAMAGVINIITKKGRGKLKTEAYFEAGSFGTYKPSLTVSGGDERIDYRLTGTYFYTDGISIAKAGTENDKYRNTSISGKFGFRPAERLDLEFTGKYYDESTDLDGFNFSKKQAADDLNYTQNSNHYIISGKGRLYLSDLWEQILTLSTIKDSLESRDPDTSFNNYDIITGMDIVDYQHNLYLLNAYTLTAGAEYRKEKGENKGNFDRAIDNKAIYLNNKLKPFEDLILNAGLRYDSHETSGSKTTYRLGAMYAIEPFAVKIRGNYSTGFRAPAFNELFYPFYGNLNLKPEETTSYDIGFEKGILKKGSSVSLTYFEQRYENLIQTDPNTWMAANIAEAEVKGIEAALSLEPADYLNIKTGYTYLDTKDKQTGERLTRRPKDKLNLSALISNRDMSVIVNYTYVGDRYDSSVKRNLSSYSLVNLSGSYKITKGIAIFGRVDNLFNADYEEAGSYGVPGVSAFAGVKAEF
ncbi:MAG: TonB-dependent receptor [Nitrospinae bacterium]|nr:TonB-dependent receptor [Nitrospinota bacterium]